MFVSDIARFSQYWFQKVKIIWKVQKFYWNQCVIEKMPPTRKFCPNCCEKCKKCCEEDEINPEESDSEQEVHPGLYSNFS